MEQQTKSLLSSKTFWMSIVTASAPIVSAIFPPVGAWLHENADLVCTGLGVVFAGLRIATNTGIDRGSL